MEMMSLTVQSSDQSLAPHELVFGHSANTNPCKNFLVVNRLCETVGEAQLLFKTLV